MVNMSACYHRPRKSDFLLVVHKDKKGEGADRVSAVRG